MPDRPLRPDGPWVTGVRTRLVAFARVFFDALLAASLVAVWLASSPTRWLLVAFIAVACRAFVSDQSRSTVLRATIVTAVGGGIMVRLYTRGDVSSADVFEIPLIAALAYLFAGFATWRSRVERSVLRDHERLAKLIDALPLATIAFDSEARVVTWNRTAELLFGVHADEAVGKKNPIVPPGQEADSEELHQRIMRGETLKGVEVERRSATGALLELSVFSASIDPEVGPRDGFLALYDDIGERKRAERERDEAQSRYRELVEALPLVTYIDNVDDHATNVYTSPQIEQLLGWRVEDWIGNTGFFEQLLHPDDAENVMTQVMHENATREGFRAEYRLRHRNGEYVWVRDHSSIVEDARGELFARGFLLDITKQKLLEEQLLHAQKMDALGQFAGGIAHDFNNLLTAISGFAELATGSARDDVLDRYLDGIRAAASEAADLTARLLSFSRQDVLAHRVIDLNELVHTADDLLRQLVRDDVTVQLDLAKALPPVLADEAQLQQVLLNLVGNACDAMPNGGTLTVRTRVHEDGVALSVGDTGHGMSDEARRRAFEPFFTTKPIGEGTGLGLAVAYGVVASLRGSLTITSTSSEGTVITAVLPAAAATTSLPAGPESRKPPEAGTGAKNVLVVEDRAVVRELIRDVLAAAGFAAVTAAGGAEALTIAAAEHFDLLLTDVVMPKMSGPELARALRTRFAGLPVIYMSGYTDDVLDARALAEPATGFLRKPFANADLVAEVQKLTQFRS
jgi:two-component system, cell cycle sensor histidine kinase and response regulator CckA